MNICSKKHFTTLYSRFYCWL